MNSIQNMVNGDTATPYSSSDFAGFSIRYFDGDYDALTEDKVTTTTEIILLVLKRLMLVCWVCWTQLVIDFLVFNFLNS